MVRQRMISSEIIILLVFVFLPGSYTMANRQRINFDFDWWFHLGDEPDAMKPGFTPSAWKWEAVQLPHDWCVHLPFDREAKPENGFKPGGVGLYKKEFHIPLSYKGKAVSIVFDGIYYQSTVYVNGEKVGFHAYGYTSFEYDISSYLKYGEDNLITVHVNHTDVSRWYTGSGIYRHVWLQVTEPLHVTTWGTYVTTPEVSKDEAKVRIRTSVTNKTAQDESVQVLQLLVNKQGQPIKMKGKKLETMTSLHIPANDTMDVEQYLVVDNPHCWSVDDPYRYFVRTMIKKKGKTVDTYQTPFGIRTLEFSSTEGFKLNGQPMKFKGVNLHQDAGGLGTAIPDRAFERRLSILKEFGCNAVRCSHNPPAPEFLEICDTLGLLVIDEAFDAWKTGSLYYGKLFDEWWQRDLADMIIRDRNHPSIIIWSIGNETREAFLKTDEGIKRGRMMQDFVHQLEPTRPVMVAMAPNSLNQFCEVFDIVGYNYQETRMLQDHLTYPKRLMLGSEVYPYYTAAHPTSSRDYIPYNSWNYVKDNDFILGSFIWAGVDYLGESVGWPSKGWASCPFDMCMVEKPVAAYHRAVWNDEPVLKLAIVDNSLNIDPGKDHWQYPLMVDNLNLPYTDDRVLEYRTMTNCDSVRLIAPHAKRTMDFGVRSTKDYPNNTIVWNQPYRPGKVLAIGYKNGVEVCRDSLVTTKKTSAFKLIADKTILKADGQDLSHIEIKLCDEDGRFVQMDDRNLTVQLEGEGRLLALDNGDMRRDIPFGSNKLKTFFGRALLIVQSARVPGVLRVKVETEGVSQPYILDITMKE